MRKLKHGSGNILNDVLARWQEQTVGGHACQLVCAHPQRDGGTPRNNIAHGHSPETAVASGMYKSLYSR